MKYIAANGKLELATGVATGDNTFLTVNFTGSTSSITPAFLNATTLGIDFGSFTGGVSVLLNNTIATFANNTIGSDGKPHQIAITNGSSGGSSNDPNYGVYGSPGFQDNATFVFNNIAVPEPSSIILLGFGAAGVFGMGLRRKKKAVVAE
jgi:hypothetical protein